MDLLMMEVKPRPELVGHSEQQLRGQQDWMEIRAETAPDRERSECLGIVEDQYYRVSDLPFQTSAALERQVVHRALKEPEAETFPLEPPPPAEEDPASRW
jgi:hypothetical protein